MNRRTRIEVKALNYFRLQLGALKKTVDDEWDPSDGDLTYLGRVSAKLPVDVKLAKLIMLGYIYGCLEEAVVMGKDAYLLSHREGNPVF